MLKISRTLTIIALTAMLSACSVIPESVQQAGRDVMKKAGAVVGAGGGATLGAIAGRNSKHRAKLIALGAVAGAIIGSKIAALLKEEDQVQLAKSTQNALVSGKSSSWKNAQTNVSGRTKVIATKTKPKPIKVKVLKSKVKKVPPLEIVGATYRAQRSTNVRGGPSTDYVIVDRLKSKETVNVVGKVKTNNWYLISRDGVGSGFVYPKGLAEAPLADIAESTEKIDEADVQEEQIASASVCRTIENTVKLSDGTTHKETINACQGTNGWVVQPTA